MKIVCDSCSTKYSISDDKVRGKVFKIRCKKCSHIIVVRGTGEGAPAVAEAPSDAVWHLVVDGDQVGPLSEAEVRARLARGEISSENYIWKEGFADWLRLVDVPEFADAGTPAPTNAVSGDLFSDAAPVSAVSTAPRNSGRHAVVEEQESFFGAGGAAQDAPRAASASPGRARLFADAGEPAAASDRDQDVDAFAAPAASVRAGEGGDLFGMAPLAAKADSGRVKTRGANGTGRHDGGRVENLTAQRSENSVLFSLSNLQSLAAPAAASNKGSSPSPSEGSGLIDIRAMAASTLKGPQSSNGPLILGGGGKSAADDLPAFGAFSSAAPVLFPIPSSSGPPKWVYALIVLAAALVIAVGAAAFSILRKPMIVEQVPAPVAPAPAAPTAPPPSAARTLAENELPPREREGRKDDSATGDKTSDKAGGDKGAAHGARHAKGGGGSGRKGASSGGDSKGSGEAASSGAGSSAAAAPDRPTPAKGSLDDLLEGALSKKARARASDDDSGGGSAKNSRTESAGGGGGGPLAKGAVVAGMNGVKGKVAACYTQFKVPGMAMVNVVISKSGKVTSATVTGKFAGTPTGTCVEGAVKSASFPASDGLTTPYPFNLR